MSDTGREGRQGELALVTGMVGDARVELSALCGVTHFDGWVPGGIGIELGGIGRAGGRGDGIGSRKLAGVAVEGGMALEMVGVGAGAGVRLVTTEGVGGGIG